MSDRYFVEVQAICVAAGFVRKGKTFFRVWGDGVLQVIQYKYERVFCSEVIVIGLFSMYDDLQAQWFTARGAIPRYSVVNCYEQSQMPQVFVPPIGAQIKMLQNRVMQWLNSIDTQKKLITAIRKLDPRWNDNLKIGPYLACGESNHAKKVIKEIICQHNYAWHRRMTMQDVPTEKLLVDFERGENRFHSLLDLINRGDMSQVDAYLKSNYDRNMRLASFCVSRDD